MPGELVMMSSDAVSRAAGLVRKGGVIAYPTDTVYGLGCDPLNESAVKRLFEVKGRGTKPVPVLCSSAAKARELVSFSPTAARLADATWPGALTIVAPVKKALPYQLTQGSGNLGVRVPSDPGCLELLERCGGWLTGTSANISGRPSSKSAREAMLQVGDLVDMVLDGGARSGKESTVVLVVGDTVTILRTGPVGVGEVKGGRTS
ncbi:MAG: threonylcarbamoyl-AMP synthase [Nitrososphaerota archaeon]|nr:threonylcarbamoyl-AMP synthase [Nitrososphaerota archaeon]